MRITVNGRALEAASGPARTLLDWLRDELGLTAAKRGCAEGHCGSCTVLVNGRPVLSCRQPLAGLDGAEVLTLEGLAAPGRLHPLQQAFIQEGAVQCGFCTPGMILAAKALLDREPQPTDRQIARALASNLCRCTGYVKILKAVHRAAEWLRQGQDSFPRAGLLPDEPAPFGRPVPRVDALGKATGELKFAEDLRFPGLLHAAVLRSEHPHARIVELDPAAARARPGVVAVLTARDLPGRNAFGLLVADQPVFAADKVRCVGDALAAVVAESEEAAREALEHIRVRYEPLPVISSPGEALAPGAARVHERTAERVGSEGGPEAGRSRSAAGQRGGAQALRPGRGGARPGRGGGGAGGRVLHALHRARLPGAGVRHRGAGARRPGHGARGKPGALGGPAAGGRGPGPRRGAGAHRPPAPGRRLRRQGRRHGPDHRRPGRAEDRPPGAPALRSPGIHPGQREAARRQPPLYNGG